MNIVGINGYGATVDRVSNNLITIARVHHETHEGELYDADHNFTAIADATSVYVAWTTPSGVYPHISYEVSASGDCTVVLLDGLTYSGGTAITAFNRNMNYADKTGVFVHTPTSPTGGTEKFPWFIPAGGKKGGSGGYDFPEKIYEPNTLYALKVTNISGGAINVGVSIAYYESVIV